MPRGRKKLTLNEQLDKITNEIENTENLLKELKTTKRQLENEIYQERLSELDVLIQENGLSFEELKEILKDSNKK